MADIKLNIIEVRGIQENADRSIDVAAVDLVRGPITLHMDEDAFRWFGAVSADKVSRWRKEDGEE
ncbi:hypothetical protein [Streptomyces rubiginosohelvolus]|uniref:hypothetical protein n=1 Tax=Streptomyces rubiginosohelvolus TaxID=67362 RepID=UPI0033B4C8C5